MLERTGNGWPLIWGKGTKQLKNNKSRDPLGFPNELFKPLNAREDLNIAILCMMNKIKRTQTIPVILKYCNITSLYENKGSRKDFDYYNYKIFFWVRVLQSILDKLIYIDKYPEFDKHMSETYITVQKGKNIRDYIFVTSAILNNIARRRLN